MNLVYLLKKVKEKYEVKRKAFILFSVISFLLTSRSVVTVANPEQQNPPLPPAQSRAYPDNLFGIDFFDRTHGIVTGYYGTVLRTVDGGTSWQRSVAKVDGVQELLRRVDMVGPKKGYAVGHRGTILKTMDGGISWATLYQQPGIYLRDVSFIDESTGWVVGHEATILFTHDGGSSWKKETLEGYEGRDMPRINGVVAIDDSKAMLVGEFGVVAERGKSGAWNLIDTGAGDTYTALAVNKNGFVVVGLDGKLIKIEESAEEESDRVTHLESGTTMHLFDIDINDSGKGYIVGLTSLLALNELTVTPVEADPGLAIKYTWFGGVVVLADGQAWAVGRLGLIAHSVSQEEGFRPAYRLGQP